MSEFPKTNVQVSEQGPPPPRVHNSNRSNKSAGVILIDPWAYNYTDPATYRVMIVQQKGSGVWGLPKGHLESGEKLYEAAIREMREETGIHLVTSGSPDSDYENALHEHVDFMQIPLKALPMQILEDVDIKLSSDKKKEQKMLQSTKLYKNHVQIKKIHFFAFMLLRSGNSLIPAPVDSDEIVRVSWLNILRWEIEAVACLQSHRYCVPSPKFNRTLSEGAISTLQDISRKAGIYITMQQINNKDTKVHRRRRCDNLF